MSLALFWPSARSERPSTHSSRLGIPRPGLFHGGVAPNQLTARGSAQFSASPSGIAIPDFRFGTHQKPPGSSEVDKSRLRRHDGIRRVIGRILLFSSRPIAGPLGESHDAISLPRNESLPGTGRRLARFSRAVHSLGGDPPGRSVTATVHRQDRRTHLRPRAGGGVASMGGSGRRLAGTSVRQKPRTSRLPGRPRDSSKHRRGSGFPPWIGND